MLAALVEDFDRVPGVETLTLLQHSLPETVGQICRRIDPRDEPEAFQTLVAHADAVLVIAPETGHVLADHSRRVVDAGKILLGCSPASIERTGDKLALARHFARHDIPTPATFLLEPPFRPCGCRFPAVCKPRDGAGSQATFLIADDVDFARLLAQARSELPTAEFVLQPFIPGQPASITFLIGPRQRLALQPATQQLSADGRFHYLGGSLPMSRPLAQRALDLGSRALATVEGLGGLVGMDMVLGEASDGSADAVIEINPRATTSYIGLRRLALDNLAEVLLRVIKSELVAPIRWRAGAVQFCPAGPYDSV